MQFKPLTEHNRLVQKIPAPANQMASISYMFNSHIYIFWRIDGGFGKLTNTRSTGSARRIPPTRRRRLPRVDDRPLKSFVANGGKP